MARAQVHTRWLLAKDAKTAKNAKTTKMGFGFSIPHFPSISLSGLCELCGLGEEPTQRPESNTTSTHRLPNVATSVFLAKDAKNAKNAKNRIGRGLSLSLIGPSIFAAFANLAALAWNQHDVSYRIRQVHTPITDCRDKRISRKGRKNRKERKKTKWALLLELLFNSLCGLCELCGLCAKPTRGIMGSLQAIH